MLKNNMSKGYALLSFDIEEFDVPCEYGYSMTLEEQISLSEQGLVIVLDILKEKNVKATFFCTTNFAINAQSIIKRLIDEGHEIASHGCNHAHPQVGDEQDSKRILDTEFNINVKGYRQPRMQLVNVERLGEYKYNASLNPTFIPGHYTNHRASRVIFKDGNIVTIPSSVSPRLRIPLFWLSLHHFPLCAYDYLMKRTLKHDGYFNTYFHPWEFVDLSSFKKLPYVIKHNSGRVMVYRLKNIIDSLNKFGGEFITYNEMIMNYKKSK